MHLLQIHEPGETPAPHAQESVPAVGIDLGTTHSLVAIARGGKVEVLRGAGGAKLIPSAVHYDESGHITVGAQARRLREAGNADAITSVKRFMGRGAEEARDARASAGEGGMVRLTLGGRLLSPVEISADILRELKAMAEAALGHAVTQAVITVPAYFDDAARTATRDAARLAGLEVLRLLNEPTAAALAYGLESGAEGMYAVYDFGGGTFDISILKLQGGVFQVLATGGDTALGGDDIDRSIAALIGPKLGLAADSPVTLALARKAKEALAEAESTNVEHQASRLTFPRGELDALALPFVERTLGACAQALRDAELAPADIKGVVLVGGSTRLALVREKVAEFFGQEPLSEVNPDEVVAAGAAIQAEGLVFGADTLLLDVVPLSLGLETMGGLTEKLILRNTPIPASATQEFTTWADGQGGMQIHVLQGEREMVEQNRSLARFEVKGIPPMPAGIARVAVAFTVDADGLLTVSAKEKTTGIGSQVEVRPTYGLPPEEMERMLLESMEHAREDITLRLLAEARMEAGRLVEEIRSALARDGELLSDAERKLIDIQIRYLQEAVDEGDRDRIDVEMQQLGRLTQDFAERRMNKAISAALTGVSIDTV